jgi:hypothetical protein
VRTFLVLAGVATIVVVVAVGLALGLAVAAARRLSTRLSAGLRWVGPAGRAQWVARRQDAAVRAVTAASRLGDPTARSAVRARLSLRQAVSSAGAAVAAAEKAGAPVGELPTLVQRLQTRATHLDQQLVLTAGSPQEQQWACAQAEDVTELARQVQRAAVDALAASGAAGAGDLAGDVRAAVAGVHAAASWLRERSGEARARRRRSA